MIQRIDFFHILNQWSTDKSPLKRFIGGGWRKLVLETRYRLTTSASISLITHFTVILIYLGIGTLDQPVESPIREIRFVDMNEIEDKPVENIVKNQTAPIIPPQLTQNLPPESNPEIIQQSPSSAINLGNDRIFLDASRTQAPINMQQYEPVASNVNQLGDVLNVSPAIGVKNDSRISKPAALDLGNRPDMPLTTSGQSSGAVAFNPNSKPQINLQSSPGTAPPGTGSSYGDLRPATPEPKKEEPELKPRETQTIITGALANRQIVKKVIPPFPEWAKRQGVGATIALRFTVMENGVVKETVIVERTSGSVEWDQMVIAALKNWKFVVLPLSGTRLDQSGVITFQFVI
jgi:TonB family protein